jgi:hypothetical protein
VNKNSTYYWWRKPIKPKNLVASVANIFIFPLITIEPTSRVKLVTVRNMYMSGNLIYNLELWPTQLSDWKSSRMNLYNSGRVSNLINNMKGKIDAAISICLCNAFGPLRYHTKISTLTKEKLSISRWKKHVFQWYQAKKWFQHKHQL